MSTLYPFAELEVVGYADVVDQKHLPRVVYPIFRKKNQDTYLFPPYEVQQGHLVDAHQSFASGRTVMQY